MHSAFPPLYAILDAGLLQGTELDVARELAESGAALFQYRNKSAAAREFFERSHALSEVLAPFADASAVRFIVNDRPDIALLAGAGGVHVGQDDLPPEAARAVVGTSRWVGVSTHTIEQIALADRTPADYLAFGPIFATNTKERHDPVVGLEGLRAARTRTEKPLVAIGGITLGNAAAVYAAGADSIAVARDLTVNGHPGDRARAYLQEAARVLGSRGTGQ